MNRCADRVVPGADVVILGAGLGGCLLATILARRGVRVSVLERGSHPRFAIGESTTPETTCLFTVLAKRYDIPELNLLASFQGVNRSVAPTCGIKRNFSFVWHSGGKSFDARQCTQFPTWAPPFGPDIHLYRQDVDAYLAALSVKYGADLRQRTSVIDIDISEDGVQLITDSGEEIHTRYVVDACGHRSPLAEKLSLREDPCRLKTRSRSLFTHMIGVRPFDEFLTMPRSERLPSPLHQGTLHHIFPGGWLWVIPFGNFPRAVNPLCSVGACFDIDSFPANGIEPQEEFSRLLEGFPTLSAQFRGARAVREWISTGRIQYSSKQTLGDRFCLLPHSAAFVDPLFSSGLDLAGRGESSLARRNAPEPNIGIAPQCWALEALDLGFAIGLIQPPMPYERR